MLAIDRNQSHKTPYSGILQPTSSLCQKCRHSTETLPKHSEPTGKMNADKAAQKAKKKRRKSILLSQQAEAALDNGSVKRPLLRKMLSYVPGGKENIAVPNEASNNNKKASKATEYRNKNMGVAVLNGALCLLNKKDPTTYRAAVMEASIIR